MNRRMLGMLYGSFTAIFLLFLWYYGVRDERAGSWNDSPPGLAGDIQEKYVLVTFQSGLDYWRSIVKGFEDAAQALNVSVEFRGATQYDANEEITVLEQVIARKPAGIAVTAINPESLNGAIAKAVKAGIPVVLFDSGAPKSEAYAFLGTDNYNAGAQAAREMGRLLQGKGRVAVVTQPSQLNHEQRTNGFRDTLRLEFPDIAVAAVEDGKGDVAISEATARSILTHYPDVDGFFATQANGGVGIGQALQDTGNAGRIALIGFDTDKGTLDMVKDGTIDATLAQGTWNMGYWSLMELFHFHHNLTQQGIEEAGGARPLPPYIDTGITVVTRTNVDQYYAK